MTRLGFTSLAQVSNKSQDFLKKYPTVLVFEAPCLAFETRFESSLRVGKKILLG